MNPNQSETKFSIQINPNQSKPELIQIEFLLRVGTNRINFDWKFVSDQAEIGLIRIENLVSAWFGFIKIVASD